MKVAISVGGRFHLFNLAQQLVKRGYLSQLITSYPKFEVKKYGIQGEMVSSAIAKEVLRRGWEHLPGFLRNLYNPTYHIGDIFDRSARSRLRPADIVVGASSMFLRTLRKAKDFGAITVVERGSTHIKHQVCIVAEEYEKFGIPHVDEDPRIVQKELTEYEETDFVSVPSLFVRKTFLDQGYPERKLIYVPYGVELSSFRQVPKEDGVFRVIFTGGMTLQKGVHYLLQAFAELKLKNAELLLVGTLADEIKPFFKKYEGSFRWIGHVPQSELYKQYSKGSVFVLNSVQDGFGMVIIQAMACGLPVIATTNTGGPDIVREGKDGFIIPIRDVDALKEKILYLYKNKEICKMMGRSARERVKSGFTWDDYGNHMVAEYDKMKKTMA